MSITARLSDWQSGSVSRIGQIGAGSWGELLQRAPVLGASLGWSASAPAPVPTVGEFEKLTTEAAGIVAELEKEVEAMPE